jgi:hypothetical protein
MDMGMGMGMGMDMGGRRGVRKRRIGRGKIEIRMAVWSLREANRRIKIGGTRIKRRIVRVNSRWLLTAAAVGRADAALDETLSKMKIWSDINMRRMNRRQVAVLTARHLLEMWYRIGMSFRKTQCQLRNFQCS